MIPPTWIAGGAAVVIAAGAIGVQSYRLNSCRADLAEAKTVIATLSAQVEAQNKAVEDWQAKAATAAVTAAQEQRKAQERAKGDRAQIKRLQAILSAPKPPVETRTCQDALRELRGVR